MNWRALLFIPALAVGIGAFMIINGRERGASSDEVSPPLIPVRVADVVLEPVTVSVTGYGRIEPVRTWEGISQVDGRIIATSDALAIGGFIQAGETVIQVDPRDYEIARDRALANLQIAQADLAELNAQEQNTAQQVALERQIEAVIQADVDRRTELVERGSNAIASLEEAQRDLISQQRGVLDLENALALYPVQRESAQAALASRQVDLEEAERQLANTRIVAPFDGRVLEENVSEGVYIRPGDALLTLGGNDRVEVVAEAQPAAMSAALALLLPDISDVMDRFNPFEEDVAINALSAAGLTATVVLSQGSEHRYPAVVVRLDGSVDNTTGTLGIVVEVSNAGRPQPGTRRPPLANGAFVSVIFEGKTKEPHAKVPRSAVIDDGNATYVYVVDGDTRLARQDVVVAGRSGGDLVVSDGLSAGDQLILTPPEPAILGSLLAPVANGVGVGGEGISQ